MHNTYSYDDKCLQQGSLYTIGTNDGKEFQRVKEYNLDLKLQIIVNIFINQIK